MYLSSSETHEQFLSNLLFLIIGHLQVCREGQYRPWRRWNHIEWRAASKNFLSKVNIPLLVQQAFVVNIMHVKIIDISLFFIFCFWNWKRPRVLWLAGEESPLGTTDNGLVFIFDKDDGFFKWHALWHLYIYLPYGMI